GLWRPVAHARQRDAAIEALQTALPNILRSAPEKIRLAALRAVSRLSITNARPILPDLIANTRLSGEVRAEALKTLATLYNASVDDAFLDEALTAAEKDANEELRKAALLILVRLGSPQAAARL